MTSKSESEPRTCSDMASLNITHSSHSCCSFHRLFHSQKVMLRFSQSDRNLFHLESIAPPVGHYKLAGDLLNKKGKSFGKRSDSRNVRMENAPGPGHYFKPVKRSPIEPVKGELYKHSNRENNISSIPSIPARDSYVYQDVGNGIIVSVRMPPIR
jgi:hypothetical protein